MGVTGSSVLARLHERGYLDLPPGPFRRALLAIFAESILTFTNSAHPPRHPLAPLNPQPRAPSNLPFDTPTHRTPTFFLFADAEMPFDHSPTELWLRGQLSNFAYLMVINHAAGKRVNGWWCRASMP